MTILDQLNARVAVQKKQQLIAKMSPLERVVNEVENYALVQKFGIAGRSGRKATGYTPSPEHLETSNNLGRAAFDKKLPFSSAKDPNLMAHLQRVVPSGQSVAPHINEWEKGFHQAGMTAHAAAYAAAHKSDGKGQHGHQVGRPTGGGNHASHSEAMAAAHDYLKDNGYHISDENWQQHVAGTRKPAEGDTNSYNIPMHKDGQETNKYAHIQVYNRGNDIQKNYELNTYFDSGKPKIVQKGGVGSGRHSVDSPTQRKSFKDLAVGDHFHTGKSKGVGINDNKVQMTVHQKTSPSKAKIVSRVGFDNSRSEGDTVAVSPNATAFHFT